MSYAVVHQTPSTVARWSIQGLGGAPKCSDMRLTGNSTVDDQAESCCNNVKIKGRSASQIAHDIGECATQASYTVAGAGACTAVGLVPLAATCGKIGGAFGKLVFNRVWGYSTEQKVVFAVGTAIFGAMTGGLGGVAAAEVIGWVSDKLSPITDAIFNPSAKKDRELAARRARNALDQATVDARKQADDAMIDLWSHAVSSIKQMYLDSLNLLAPASRAKLVKILGFTPNYDGVAKALVANGAPTTPLSWQTSGYGEERYTIADRLHHRRDIVDGRGCETTGVGCQNDGYSEVCPFSFLDYYMAFSNAINWKGTSRDQQMKFETKMLGQMQDIADGVFVSTQNAIGNIVTQIMVTATMLQLSDTQAATANASDSTIVAKAAAAAAYTEAAAQRAKSWSPSVRASALVAAENGYQVARHTNFLLQTAGSSLTASGSPARPPVTAALAKTMNAAMARATAARDAAKSNALHAQIMMGVVAAAGVTGVGYLFLRRS